MSALLASGGRDGLVCVYSADADGRLLSRFGGHTGGVSGVAFVAGGSAVVSASLDHTLRLTDVTTGRMLRTFTDHDEAVTSVVRLDDVGQENIVASASSDGSVRVFDVRADQPCVAVMFDHDAAVYGLASMRDSTTTTLLSTSWDRTVKAWNLRMATDSAEMSKRCVRTLTGHTDAVRTVVQLDSHHIVSAGWDSTIRIWDLDQPEEDPAAACVGTIRTHTAWIYALSYLPEQQLIVSGSGDRSCRLSSPTTQKCVSVLTGHENTIWCLAALPSTAGSERFASGGAEGQIRLWNPQASECMRIDGGHRSDASVYCLDAWSAEARLSLKPLIFASSSIEEASHSICESSASPAATDSSSGLLLSEPITAFSDLEYTTLAKRYGTRSTLTSCARAAATFTAPSDIILADGAAAASLPALAADPFESSASPSPPAAESHPSSLLRSLQSTCLQHLAAQEWLEAEQSLLQLLAIVEGEHKPSSPADRVRLLPATAASLRFFIYHDLSLCALRRGEFVQSLRYTHQSLACFEEEEEEAAECLAPNAERSKKINSTGASRRSEHIRRPLLEESHLPQASLGDILPSTIALQHVVFHGDSSSPTYGAPLSPGLTRSSLYAPLLLRRLWCAFSSRDTELSLACSIAVLALVEETQQAREIILDELECAALANHSPMTALPKTTLYAHVLDLHTSQVLVAALHSRLASIHDLKQQGNDAYAVASAAPVPLNDESPFFRALNLYERAIAACTALTHLLDSPDSCPSVPWFESIAASPSANHLLDGAMPPAWSMASLQLVHAQLLANACMAVLKCHESDLATAATTRARSARGHAEAGIEVLEKLQQQLKTIRAAVDQAPKIALLEDEDDDDLDPSVRIFLVHPALYHSLPSPSVLLALQSKLFFRHGLACFEFDLAPMDALAEKSWSLALQLQPDEKVKRDIQTRKARRLQQQKA